MIKIERATVPTPDRWFLCFWPIATGKWWIDGLACGRYKHVSLFGYIPRSDSWVFIEPAFTGTVVLAVRAGPDAVALQDRFMCGSDVMVVEATGARPPVLHFLGGWCVPTIARIIGRGFCALRPDGLWKCCEPHAIEVFPGENAKAATADAGRSARTAAGESGPPAANPI